MLFNLAAELKCPGCKAQLGLAKPPAPGDSRICPNCGAKVTFKGDDLRQSQAAVDDLEKAFDRLKSLGKR